MPAKFVRISRALTIPVVSAASIVLILLDWPLGYARNLYLDHPLITGVIGSLIPIGISITVVKAYLDRRDNIKWQIASKVAYNSLLRAPLAQRRVMWFLLCGGPVIEDRDFAVEPERESAMRRILRHHHISERSEAASFMEGRPDLENRLERLAADPKWQKISYELLRATSHGFRAVIARWAPLLSSSSNGQRILTQVAAQEKELTDLYIRLVPTARLNGTLNSADRQNFMSAWQNAFANAIVLAEYLTREGEEYRDQKERIDRHLLNADEMRLILQLEAKGKSVTRLYSDDIS